MSLSAPSINQEIRRCAEQDATGLACLVHDHAPQLLAYAQCLLDAQQSQQLVIDCYRLVWQHAAEYSVELGDSLGWLMSIFRHLLRQKIHQHTPALVSVDAQATTIQALIEHIRTADATHVLASALDSCDEPTLSLLLGRYFFAWDDQDCMKHTGLAHSDIEKKLQALYAYLTLYFEPWAVQDVAWQTLNAQACLDSLNPADGLEAVNNRRQRDTAAAKDTLRWEALLAQLCGALPTTTPSAEFISALQKQLQIELPKPKRSEPQQPEPTLAETEKPEAALSKAALPTPELSHPVQEQKTEPAAETAVLKRSLFRWKVFSLLCLLGVIALTVPLFIPSEPPVTIVQMAPRLGAVLQAPGHSATPGWVLSVDPQGQVLLTPLVTTEIEADQTVQLWTRRPGDNELQSLGLINPNAPVALTADTIGTVQEGQLFEMTLESSAQQSETEPLGPVLFLGRVVSLGKYEDF